MTAIIKKTASIKKTAIAAAFEAAGTGANSKAFAIDLPGHTQITIDPDAASAPIDAPADAIADATNNESADDAIAAFRAYVVESAKAFTDAIKTVQESEKVTQKQWGHKALRIAFHHKVATVDSVINDTRVILGWDSLFGEVGKKLTNSYNQWFNNLRMVSERWNTLDAATKADLMNGAASISTLATRWKQEATKAKRDAAKAAKAEADNAKADGNKAADNTAGNTKPATLANTLAYISGLIDTASDDDIAAHAALMDEVAGRYHYRMRVISDAKAESAQAA